MSNSFNFAKKKLDENQYEWLVTGGAGFIGSNLIEFLLKNGQKVRALDNFITGKKKNIDEIIKVSSSDGSLKNFQFIEGDINDLGVCYTATKDIDFVLHQAALGSVPRSISDPLSTHESNVTGFLNIILASKDNGVKNFVYASSSSIYGDCEELEKKEEHTGKPLSPYAVSKLTNEFYASSFNTVYYFNSVGLRYFNVFGKRQDPEGEYAAVIPKWIDSMIKNEPIYINGDGSTTRDFCYIDNVVQANVLAAFAQNNALNQVYNIALNQSIDLNQLHNIINSNLEDKIPEYSANQALHRDFRKGDIMHSKADITKAKRVLGYKPTKSVEEGLEELIDYQLKENE